jgi:hypothetical protein
VNKEKNMDIQSFIKDECIFSRSAIINKIDLYRAYADYDNKGVNRREFNQIIGSDPFVVDGGDYWFGIETRKSQEEYSPELRCLLSIRDKVQPSITGGSEDYLADMIIVLCKKLEKIHLRIADIPTGIEE